MRSLLPMLTENSVKYLRSIVKNFPNSIYSVEIKIKRETPDPRLLVSSQTSHTSNNGTNGNPTQDIVVPLEAISDKPADSVPTSDSSKNNKLPKAIVEEAIPQMQIIERTSQLVRKLNTSSDQLVKKSLPALVSLNSLLTELSKQLQKHPEATIIATRENVTKRLLRIRQQTEKLDPSQLIGAQPDHSMTHLKKMNENSRQILTLLGHTDPPKGRGIKILSIDGGGMFPSIPTGKRLTILLLLGTRGLVVIEILRQIEQLYGKPIHQIFDLICGVSTGAIISMLLGALRISIDEVEHHYRQVSSYLFNTDIVRGTGRLLWSHAYYDTAVFEKILREIYGEAVLIDTRKHADCPHLVAISAIVNLPTLQPFLFRNYELHPSSKPLSHFQGSPSNKIWQAVRASAAAPGYFEEFTLGKHVHQDGGILLNNPTAVAVHEAKLLWPNEEIQCVVSLGSGRYHPTIDTIDEDNNPATLSSLKHKILRLIDSATDTEMVHRLMQDLLPVNSYYRINPVLRDQSTIDENRPEKLEQMITDAQMYLRKNERKFSISVEQLKLQRTLMQQALDTAKFKSKIYLQ